MRKYFNTKHIDAIEIEELTTILNHADSHPKNYIRIVMDEEFSFLDIRGDEEEILQATVFVEDRFGNFRRYDFEPEETEKYLYMAIDPEEFIALSIGDPDKSVDGIGQFRYNEAIFGIFKTTEANFTLIYRGDQDEIECRYYPDSAAYDETRIAVRQN